MMSLFSSFDLSFFDLAIFSLFFSLSLLLTGSIYFVSNNAEIKLKIQKFFLDYFFTVDSKEFKGKNFLILCLGIMICLQNFISIFPFNFSVTSQISVVLGMSLSFWLSGNIISVIHNGKGVLSHMVPQGCPMGLSWFLFLIELVSNFIRPLTLSIRLVANILAGHLLLSLLSLVVFKFSLSLGFYIILNCLEFFVSIIQAYIMVTMIQLYYSEI